MEVGPADLSQVGSPSGLLSIFFKCLPLTPVIYYLRSEHAPFLCCESLLLIYFVSKNYKILLAYYVSHLLFPIISCL
jgi:hypothetical protein